MNLQHLRYIIEVEKTGSISKAANNLFMGQPNLSKAIKELEEETGICIFNRTAKGVETTERGAEFLAYAKTVMAKVEEMESFYKNIKEDRQHFNISIPRASYIADAFVKFVQSLDCRRTMSLNFKETNSMEAINNILENRYNLGIIRYPNLYEPYFLSLLTNKDLKHEVIWEFDYVIIMSRRHPLADREIITREELEDYVEVVHGDLSVPNLSPSYLRKAEGKKSGEGSRIYVYERGSQFDLLTGVADSYMWVSPLPQNVLDRYGLVEKRCQDAQRKNKDVLIYPTLYHLNELDKAFIRYLYEVRDEVASRY